MEIDATTLAEQAAEVRELALPAVRVTPGATGEPDGKASRFGGLPLGGPGFAWPRADDGRPLCLVGHLDCDQVNRWLGAETLPPGTLLGFFYDVDEQATWGMTPGDEQYWRVVAADRDHAAPAVAPEDATVLPAQVLDGRRVTTIPHPWEPVIKEFWARSSTPELWPDAEDPEHRILGWPNLQQGPMQEDCQLVAGGVDLFGSVDHRDPRVVELAKGSDEWLLLWQIDTDEDWMWGDMGMLYFWIRRPDLAAGRFDRVWMLIQG